MVAHALIAMLVVHAGAMSPAPPTTRSPGPAVPTWSDASATAGHHLRLLVRIDAHAAANDVRISDLIEGIREIWRPYAEIDFAAIGTEAAACDDELRLVITDRIPPRGPATAAVLGSIQFLDGQPQNTITVSVTAARTMMSRGKWMGRTIDTLPPSLRQRFMTRTLSRSAAHEIGHYLLRSGAHAPRGLMRERMTVEEIMDDAPALYRLLPGEIASLHQRRAGAPAGAPASDPRRAILPRRDRKP